MTTLPTSDTGSLIAAWLHSHEANQRDVRGDWVSLPMKVRYEKFSGDSGWILCEDADVANDVLTIKYSEDSMDLIPLHVIRGKIEIRPNDEEDE